MMRGQPFVDEMLRQMGELNAPEGKAMVQTETGWTEARCKERQ